ncbi:MAG: hypothetical protein ABH815_04590 [Candidatus Omnitrophota bacterium]
MRVEKDYEDLLRLFNKNKVKYFIIGAYAVAFYARPRYTKDMDILVEPDIENGERIIKALKEFGFKSRKLSAKDFAKKGNIIQLGYEPIRVDIITSIPKVNFKEIWKNKKRARYGDENVFFIGQKDLIKIKKTSGREQDKIDIKILTANL